MDVGQPIVVVYGEAVVEVGLRVEFGIIGGKTKGLGVMRRRRVGGSGGGVGFFTPLKLFLSQTSLGIGLVWFGLGLRTQNSLG